MAMTIDVNCHASANYRAPIKGGGIRVLVACSASYKANREPGHRAGLFFARQTRLQGGPELFLGETSPDSVQAV